MLIVPIVWYVQVHTTCKPAWGTARYRSCRIPARSHPLAVRTVDRGGWGPLRWAQQDEMLSRIFCTR